MRFEKLQGIEVIRTQALEALRRDYDLVCKGVDPVTKKQIYVDCEVGETIYRMNAGEEAAKKMDAGMRIFERMGAPTMPKVRDFYNENHYAVPMADAIAISLKQAEDALWYWSAYGDKVDALTAPGLTVDDIRQLQSTTTFTVQVLPD